MTTTTRITQTHILDTDEAYGEHYAEYDRDAIAIEYRDQIQALLPAGVTLALNGEVFAEVVTAPVDLVDTEDDPYAVAHFYEGTPVGLAQAIDWDEITESCDFWEIVERHVLPEAYTALDVALALVKSAEDDLTQHVAARDSLIRDARAAGMSATDLATRTGLSIQRVYQILAALA